MLAPLIAPEGLAALAALQSVPCVAWIMGPDLVFQAVAGSLAGLFPDLVGRTLYEVNGTDSLADPAVGAHDRALRGQRTPYVSHGCGQWWQSVVTPIQGGRDVLGVLGIASPLTVAEAEEGPQPCRFVVTMDVPELWIGAGDRVVTYPGAEWRARAVRDVSPEAVVRLMSLGALAPFMPDVATDESSASGASVRPIQSLRPGPRARRLSSS